MEQADWQKRGSGGIVSAVDAGTGTLTIAVRSGRKIAVTTSSATKYRRYAGDSVKFEDAQAGTLAQIQTGDQLRVRGAGSPTMARRCRRKRLSADRSRTSRERLQRSMLRQVR